ncbi:MAG TPA: hypothetical protein VKZ18_00885 [Polyangia bacterium]|nr:hypothetical protein [Polyangia bacterium]
MRRWVVAALLLGVGCGGPPPGVLVGQSAHFRLYVDPALMPVAPPFDGDNALAALETEWSDVQTMLHMPDGIINYYWLTTADAEAACGSPDEGACTKESALEIDSPTLPNPHELNHAYLYLRKQRKPIPLLAEGAAEAIACGQPGASLADSAPWPGLVAEDPPSDEAYLQGGLLARYLIRTQGIDAFLRYYEQSPERRDPALFGANFHSFWGVTLDEVWSAMHIPLPGEAVADQKICPCSLPPPGPGATATNDPVRDPYWVVSGPEAMALVPPPTAAQVTINDCGGLGQTQTGQVVLARIDSAAPWYAMAPANVMTGPYLADDCAGTIPYTLPANAVSPSSPFSVFVELVASSAASAQDVYFQLGTPFAGKVGVAVGEEICGSCGFDQGSCQPMTAFASVALPGPTVYGRWTVPGGAVGVVTQPVVLSPP